jgi:hypothetical protein
VRVYRHQTVPGGSDHEVHEGHEELHFWGNCFCDDTLVLRGEFNLKEESGDCGLIRRAMPFVLFVCFVVASL